MTNNKQTLKEQIIGLLKKENKEHVEAFASYCLRLATEKVRGKEELKNPWMSTKTPDVLAKLFQRVKAEGLVFDGKHVTLLNRGISYDYQAYKNKMLLVYPESKIDVDVVKEGDTVNFDKVDGDITYRHIIKDAFQNPTFENIKGAYCVIRNSRGAFLTTLSKEEIQKHRAIAQTDQMWKAWFKEMVLKTVLKKGYKYHFDDLAVTMNEDDNQHVDLERVIADDEDQERFEEEKKRVLDVIKTYSDLKKLREYFKTLPAEFSKDEDVIEAFKAHAEVCKNTK
jgi:hypothetical protein